MPESRRDARLRTIIEQHIAHSNWQDDGEEQQSQRAALDSYFGRDMPKTTDGRSTARSQDFEDMVEAVTAQIMPAFKFEDLAMFKGQGAADVEQARFESRVTSAQIRRGNQYIMMQTAVRNALMLRNGIIACEVEEQEQTTTRRYQGLDPIEYQNAVTAVGPNEQRTVVSQELGEEPETLDVSVRITTTWRRLSLRAVDRTTFIMTPDWTEWSLQEIPMCGERMFYTRSDLRLMGIPKRTIDKLPTASGDSNVATQAMNQSGNARNWTDYGDDSQERYECFRLYVMTDYDGDGIAERRRVLYAGGTSGGAILQNELVERVPYASGTCFLVPNRWKGKSLHDKLAELARVKTEGLRQYLDNMEAGNFPELEVVDEQVAEPDLDNRRPGGRIRVDAPGSVNPIPVQDLSAASQGLLNYMDKVRTERGGAALDLQAAELQLAGETAHGVERQYTSKEQLAQLMAETLAETLLLELFWLVHETMRRDLPERQEVALASQFVTVQPGTWRYRDIEELELLAGMTGAQRRAKQLAHEQTLGQQEKLMQAGFGGGILVNLQTYYDTLMDWLVSQGIPNPRRYFVDPRSDASVQAQQRQQQSQQQQAQEQRALQQLIFRSQMAIEGSRNQKDLIIADADQRRKYWEAVLDALVERERIAAQNDTPSGVDDQELDAAQAVGTARTFQ